MELDLFGEEVVDNQRNTRVGRGKYTTTVDTPIYTPSNRKPNVFELFDSEKTKRMIKEIENSNISDIEKRFLINAAYRHVVFNYSLIADYYAQSSKEMQDLMEKSALVIIDYDKSIEYGFTKLTQELQEVWLKNQYLKAKNNEK